MCKSQEQDIVFDKNEKNKGYILKTILYNVNAFYSIVFYVFYIPFLRLT